jgi:hypothetical protein
MNTTKKEKTVLQLIAQNEMNAMNYGVPEIADDTFTWCNCIDAGYIYEHMTHPSLKSIPGTVASLVKKGLLVTNGETIGHSEIGFALWKSEIYIDESEKDEETEAPVAEVTIKNIIGHH